MTDAGPFHTQEDIQPLCESSVRGPTVPCSEPHAVLSDDPVLREAKWQSLLSEQREMESESMAEGAKRFQRRIEQAEAKGRYSEVGAAKRLLTHGIVPTENAINYFLAEQRAKRGVKHAAVKWIEKMSEHHIYFEDDKEEKPWRVRDEIGKHVGSYKTEEEAIGKKKERELLNPGTSTVAYLTVRAILDRITRRPRLAEVAFAVVDLLIDELRYRRFEREAPGLFKYKLNSFSTSSYVHMARSMDAAMRHADIDCSDLHISKAQRIAIGVKLIDLVMQSTGLIETELETTVLRRKRKAGIQRDRLLVATPETLEFMNKRNGVLEFLSPILMPMVVPPLQWSPGYRGGYRFGLRYKTDLVRGSPAQTKTAERREMPVVYTALNAIQNTAWQINGAVLDLVLAIEERGLEIGGVLPGALEPDAPKPLDIEENEGARKEWRKRQHGVIERNRAKANRLSEIERVLTMAKRVRSYDAIFFPHNLDFRGRIYPVSHFLTPQGDDLQKGLLTFAQGKPLGDMGATYLALHGMNCLDKTPSLGGAGGEGAKVKRMTLDERVQWVMDHSAEICAVANDPFGYRWWAEAEEPLQFYAFCREWNGFVQLQKEGRGHEYVCSLPVSIDGSCNGLQHFSAMLRDEVGARAVNVFPNQIPEDVYDRVAEKVKDKLETPLDPEERALSAIWLALGIVDRKLTKRPTMTFSYGSKMYGFADQIAQYLAELDDWKMIREQIGGPDQVKPMCNLMARLIWESLQDVVVAAFNGMEWMQNVARIISKTGKPIEWTVPLTGFHVRQEYYVSKMRQIKTVLAGQTFKPAIREATPVIQLHKQANAVSPNVVHSLDAAALMIAVANAQTEGIEQFAAIHDSYGTLAADMEIIWRAARQSFVHLYVNHNVIEDFAGQFQAQAPEGQELPKPPAFGSLDVSAVTASNYFFC